MKKYIIILISSLFLSVIMQAQDRTQPKPGPSPKININKPQTFTLPNGLKVLVVENHKLPRVSFSLTIDNAPYAEGDKKGVSNLLASLLEMDLKQFLKTLTTKKLIFLVQTLAFLLKVHMQAVCQNIQKEF